MGNTFCVIYCEKLLHIEHEFPMLVNRAEQRAKHGTPRTVKVGPK